METQKTWKDRLKAALCILILTGPLLFSVQARANAEVVNDGFATCSVVIDNAAVGSMISADTEADLHRKMFAVERDYLSRGQESLQILCKGAGWSSTLDDRKTKTAGASSCHTSVAGSAGKDYSGANLCDAMKQAAGIAKGWKDRGVTAMDCEGEGRKITISIKGGE